jgi:hypothetical protein
MIGEGKVRFAVLNQFDPCVRLPRAFISREDIVDPLRRRVENGSAFARVAKLFREVDADRYDRLINVGFFRVGVEVSGDEYRQKG